MSWEEIGILVQILGTLAVFVSLIYLAIQVRQASKIAQASTRQAISDSIMGPPANFLQSESFRTAFLTHLDDKELNPDQALQLHVYCYITLKSWENMHYQHKHGMITKEEWIPIRKNLKFLIGVKMWKEYWTRENELFSPDFQKEIEGILSEIAREDEAVHAKTIAHLKNDEGKDSKVDIS